MSMFQVTGQVMNVFYQPGRADPETGEYGKGKEKVQIMGDIPVSDGGSKFDLITLSIPEGLNFEPYIKKSVSVPLGFFAPAKGSIVYFIPKGSEIVSESPEPNFGKTQNSQVKSPI